MSERLDIDVERASTTNSTRMVHEVCNPCDKPLCGAQICNVEVPYSTPIGCVVCAEMAPGPCPRCGTTPL